MSSTTADHVAPVPTEPTPPDPRQAARREPLVPSNVLGMLIFVVTEVMFFAGLISAYTIAEGASSSGWPPPGQPRLPIEATALNTLALLASGVVLWHAGRVFRSDAARAIRPYLLSMLLGAFFVLFQGVEWVGLIREGLTLTYSTHGAFFYLIVGVHALHAVVAILLLAVFYRRLRAGTLGASTLWTGQIFWYFVVGVWPVLYYLVYL